MHVTRIISSTAIIFTLLVTACGDDDEGAQESYCDVAAELASQGEVAPTIEQLDRMRDAAPEEIEADVETAAGILEEHLDELEDGDTDVFQDPELGAAIGRIQAYDAEHCDFER